MKISEIKSNKYTSLSLQKNIQNRITNKNYAQFINFQGNLVQDSFIKLEETKPINLLKQFTKEEYLKLTEIQKKQLRIEYNKLEAEHPTLLKHLGEIHAYISRGIKEIFDKRFGKDKYEIILIGRSLSTFEKPLATFIGSNNVKTIPMSNARRFLTDISKQENYEDFVKNLKDDKGFKEFTNFLNSHNLSKEDVNSSGKSYILMDYGYSGKSLMGTEQLFKSDMVWGNNKKNIHTVDFMRLIENFDETNFTREIANDNTPIIGSIMYKLRSDLFNSAYKDFSTIGRAENFSDTTKAANKKLDTNAKLIYFNLIDKSVQNKGMYNIKFRQTEEKFESEILSPIPRNQNIELWHDSNSQYESDLRNKINDINKILQQTGGRRR